MSVLVTGGAGYIGSHMSHALIDRGERVVVLDNLSTGNRSLVASEATFVLGDAGNQDLVRQTISNHDIESVIHFAGSVVVPESVTDPLRYYAYNTETSRLLMEVCVQERVNHFLFSSSAAVYGMQNAANVNEETVAAPLSPYGRSKLMTEWMLEDAARASDLRYVALRYFNVAGADALKRTGQSTPLATHLIKRCCRVALGRAPFLEIFGTDFPTPDGTGIRDYIHISDLINAHLLSLDALRSGAKSRIYNCGYGKGFSVRQVVNAVERTACRKVSTRARDRRLGDPPALIADSSRLQSELHWIPKHADLDLIVQSAFEWERGLSEGPMGSRRYFDRQTGQNHATAALIQPKRALMPLAR